MDDAGTPSLAVCLEHPPMKRIVLPLEAILYFVRRPLPLSPHLHGDIEHQGDDIAAD